MQYSNVQKFNKTPYKPVLLKLVMYLSSVTTEGTAESKFII